MQNISAPLGPSCISDMTSSTAIRSRMSARGQAGGGANGWPQRVERRTDGAARHNVRDVAVAREHPGLPSRTKGDVVLERLCRGVQVRDAHRPPLRRAVLLDRLAIRRLRAPRVRDRKQRAVLFSGRTVQEL